MGFSYRILVPALTLLLFPACNSSDADQPGGGTPTGGSTAAGGAGPGGDGAGGNGTGATSGEGGSGTGGAGGTAAPCAGTPAPDFSLTDSNASSTTFGQTVSPRDYLQEISVYYFTSAL